MIIWYSKESLSDFWLSLKLVILDILETIFYKIPNNSKNLY